MNLDDFIREYGDIEQQLGDPAVHADQNLARTLGKRYAHLRPIVETYREIGCTEADLTAAIELAPEDEAFAKEAAELEQRKTELEAKLQKLLIPRDPSDDKDVILQIKAGEGGEESALFAGDLLRMYTRYAERVGWNTEIIDAQHSDLGGYKDVTLVVKSKDGAWSQLKFEGGVHRVQRVPVTESQGRIHTSAAGVMVSPEAEDVDVHIDPNDLRIDVYRSSGPGGQGVNTTDSAVRITHLPTGIVVSCQNERSQLQNKATAMAVLQAKLLERRRHEERAQMDALRGDVGGSWGNQIRSYVLHPYQMVKDLRTEVETGNTAAVLDGDIDRFVEAEIRWKRQQDS